MKPVHRAHILVVLALLLTVGAGYSFRSQWQEEELFPFAATARKRLSDYHAPLLGTHGDTDVFIFESGQPGGTLLLCGGTHPNEPAGYLAAVAAAENLRVTAGRVIVIARSNESGFTHTDSQEAAVLRYSIKTPAGDRRFRNGSRFSNPVHQWPDPTVYRNPTSPYFQAIHAQYCCGMTPCKIGNPGPGNQTLSGVDSRNLNRVYPGLANGTLTEQVAYAIVELIRSEKVDLAIDYHEASPEYPTINVMVAHQRAESLTSWAELGLSDDGITISTESSSLRLRGLSHREWGDNTETLAVLFESANPAQGRLKGRPTEEQIVLGKDAAYARLQQIQNRLNERLRQRAEELEKRGVIPTERSRKVLQIDFPPEGIPLEVRVGRHLQTTIRLIEAYNMEHEDLKIVVTGLPTYADLERDGLGRHVAGPNGEHPAGAIKPVGK